MINALNIKLMFLFMVVLLANGCQKKTGAPDQLQNESVISVEEESLQHDFSYLFTRPEIDIGIVNDNAVRIRDQLSPDAAIIGQLDQGMKVSVLGRSGNRVFLDGYDSFWLRIRKDNIEGWAYGAYINLTNYQYDLLPVITTAVFASAVDLNYPRNLHFNELIQKERETITLQSARFLNCSVEEYYDAIASTFELRQSLRRIGPVNSHADKEKFNFLF